MYPKIDPRRHDAVVHHENENHKFYGSAISEVAVYGAFLRSEREDRSSNRGNDIESCDKNQEYSINSSLDINSVAGVGARVGVCPHHLSYLDNKYNSQDLAKSLGYGAISAVQVCYKS